MKMTRRFNLRRVAVTAIAFSILMGLSIDATASGNLPMIGKYAEQINKQAGGFAGFSAERGRSLFSSNHATGKPETPSCTSCHTNNPAKVGQTRAGKSISPLAISKSPERYADPKKVEKWFRRNCNSVLGRECTPLEKGDFLTFMASQ